MNTLDFYPNQLIYFIDDSVSIKKMEYQHLLYEFFSDETTSPRGVEPRLFVEFLTLDEVEENLFNNTIYIEDDSDSYSIEEIKKYADYDACKFYNEENCCEMGVYTISTWGCCGNNRTTGKEFFSTKEEALNALLLNWQYNKENSDEFIEVFDTYEEAEERYFSLKADEWEVSLKVAKSILRKEKCLEKLRKEKQNAIVEAEKERIGKLAEIYAQMIKVIPGESYKETAGRLSNAIGEKIEGKVFHKAIKLIRKN